MEIKSFGYIRFDELRLSRSQQESRLAQAACREIAFYYDNSNQADRAGLQHLLESIRNSKNSTLFVYDLKSLDSTFESLNTFLEFISALETSECRLISICDSIPSKLTANTILKMYFETSKAIHRENIQSSLIKRKNNGQSIGRPSTRNDSEIFELRSQGLTFRQIAQQLNLSLSAVQRGLSTVKKS